MERFQQLFHVLPRWLWLAAVAWFLLCQLWRLVRRLRPDWRSGLDLLRCVALSLLSLVCGGIGLYLFFAFRRDPAYALLGCAMPPLEMLTIPLLLLLANIRLWLRWRQTKK